MATAIHTYIHTYFIGSSPRGFHPKNRLPRIILFNLNDYLETCKRTAVLVKSLYLTQLNLIVTAVINIVFFVRILTVFICHAPTSFCARSSFYTSTRSWTCTTTYHTCKQPFRQGPLGLPLLSYHEHRLNNTVRLIIPIHCQQVW